MARARRPRFESPSRKRGKRREQILAAAASLFSSRGYGATGIDEIGEAAGITGGAVYRHFDSKLELFRAVIEPMAERRARRIAAIADEARSPREALGLLVENMVDAILEDRSITAALWRELRHIDAEGGTWFDRVHALQTNEFVVHLRELRADLSVEEAEVRTQGFFGLAFSAAEFEHPLPREDLRRLLNEVGVSVLLC